MRNIKFPFLVIILTIGIALGILIEKVFSDDKTRVNLLKFKEILSLTEKYYLEDVNSDKLVEDAINGMLSNLDPHSVYIPASQMEGIEESFRGDFEGIGIEFQIINDTLTVISPISGGPSESLGILSGDKIVKIDGKNVVGIKNDDVRKSLRGKAGSTVKVTIYRHGVKDAITYTIIRDKIPIYSVDTHFMLDNTTGYVSISRFAEKTYDELLTALKDLKNRGMKQLVLDLRSNPGGYLNQAFQIADLFIDGDKKIVYTKGRISEFNEEFYASEPSEYEKMPLVVLINNGSASASEIVSGAIQDWDRGLIVGETSFGKGLVQRQYTLSDNSAVRLTVSEYYTPSGRLIQRDYKGKKDKEEYYSEAYDNEEENGDNLTHKSESDSSKPVYKTNKGRIVYGGGGITPDFIQKSEKLTKLTTDLLKNNLFYVFALELINNESKSFNQIFPDLNSFIKNYNISETSFNRFLSLAKSKGINVENSDLKKDKEYILLRIKAQIARNYWKNEGWYSILINGDEQVLKAKTLFNEAKKLANLK